MHTLIRNILLCTQCVPDVDQARWCLSLWALTHPQPSHPCQNVNQLSCKQETNRVENKFAQSNLGRGPCRGAVEHIHRKVPIGYNGAPQIRPQKYHFPWTDSQTTLSASSLDPSDLWHQTTSGSDPPFFHNALDRPTHRQTDAQTDRLSTGKFDHYRPLRL